MIKKAKGLVLLIMVVAMFGCATIQGDWEKAQGTDTVGAYKDFVSKHPEGAFAQEANSRIEKLEWEKAQGTDTVGAFKDFMSKHPEGAFAQEANSRIEKLEWEKAQGTNTVAAYKEFVSKHPKGAFVQEANSRIEKLLPLYCKAPTIEGNEIVIRVSPDVFNYIDLLDKDIVFFTSKRNPLKCLELLDTSSVGVWGGELFNKVSGFLKVAGLPSEPIKMIGNGHFDTLFNKFGTLLLFVTHREYIEELTTSGGGIVVRFKKL